MENRNILITVFIPVYNRDEYVSYAIESVLKQSYRNFELIIINDGSTDNSLSVIQSFVDNRIKVINNDKNKGLITVANQAIELSQGEYFARLDSDDIATPNWLQVLLSFLENNKNHAIVSSRIQYFNKKNLLHSYPEVASNNDSINISKFFHCPLIQGSMMIRYSVLEKFRYGPLPIAEDYFLFINILNNYKGYIINDILVFVRLHKRNISNLHKTEVITSLRIIYQKLLKQLQLSYTEDELDIYIKISGSYTGNITLKEIYKAEKWLLKIRKHLIERQLYKQMLVNKEVSKIWYLFTIKTVKIIGIKGYWIYLKSKLSKETNLKEKILLLFHTIGQYPVFRKFYIFFKTRLYNSKY